MRKSGYADLPLHNGRVPRWLADRMALMGGAIIEAVAIEYGKAEVLRRLSDPAWFQSLGCVLGMDWHSSGITTSVVGALKKAINPMSRELGIYICGGRGRHSRKAPEELMAVAEKTGLDGTSLVKSSRLTAKVDNTAVQDGYQIYLHAFIVSDEGEWAVVQQGMNGHLGYARRYHWHSAQLADYTEEPHTSIYGRNHGPILNLTARAATGTKTHMLGLCKEGMSRVWPEVCKMFMPGHHDVRQKDVDMKRLGALLAMTQDVPVSDFESLLLLQGVGPRTLQSLALVSEVIYGTPSRFSDPARFSFAHGGKDGHPFPVPTQVYDEGIGILKVALERARIQRTDKLRAIQSLHQASMQAERHFCPTGQLEDAVTHERDISWKYGGRTVQGYAKPPSGQLRLF